MLSPQPIKLKKKINYTKGSKKKKYQLKNEDKK